MSVLYDPTAEIDPTTWADDLVDRIQPWYTPDLEDLARAFGGMWEELQFYVDDVRDVNGDVVYPGWSVMLDPDRCKVAGLPYLAMYVGERLPTGLEEAQARKWVKDAPNQWRGTPYSVARAAQRWLTGSKTVQIRERSMLDGTAHPRYLAVQTFEADTPDPDLVVAELRKVVPAFIKVDYQNTPGATWQDVKQAFTTWADVMAANATWADVQSLTPGYVSWT